MSQALHSLDWRGLPKTEQRPRRYASQTSQPIEASEAYRGVREWVQFLNKYFREIASPVWKTLLSQSVLQRAKEQGGAAPVGKHFKHLSRSGIYRSK
jgi:hypothetical protein